MERYESEDPVLLDTFSTDSKGRLNLGERYAEMEVKVLVVDVKPTEEKE